MHLLFAPLDPLLMPEPEVAEVELVLEVEPDVVPEVEPVLEEVLELPIAHCWL
jgi:hypothetical protein